MKNMKRATVLTALSLATLGAGTLVLAQTMKTPKLAKKATYRVGFAQTESNNPWRLAQTKSMQDEAKRLGFTLVYTDAAGSAAKQVSDVRSMIAQKVDAIVLAPADSRSLAPACKKAMDAGIVVINIDNRLDKAALADQKVAIPFVGPDNRKGAR
ncbi:MAG: substrate-binding domain-containing protein, partial [Deinococcus sp.]